MIRLPSPASALLAPLLATAGPLPEARLTAARIEAALAAQGPGGSAVIAGWKPLSDRRLAGFYARRGFEPAWIRFGIPDRQAWQMLAAARDSRSDGLDPEAYHARALDSLLRLFHRKIFLLERPGPDAALHLELLLTDAFLGLGAHLLDGASPPRSAPDPWHAFREPADPAMLLQAALASGADMRAELAGMAPREPEYAILKGFLAGYRRIREAGGWPAIPAGGILGPGARGPRVAALCGRLKAEGDLPRRPCGDSFTADLAEALKRFQERHGSDTSSVVRKADLEHLNAGVDKRIAQIQANLENRRWLPRDPGIRHIRVNLADFSLSAYDSGAEAMRMKVVIGRRQDRTPVFHDRITALELNPPWNIPDNIAREEILPELRKNPRYLAKHGMQVLSGWSGNADTLDPSAIDWDKADPKSLPYRFLQKAGPGSALGRLKFVLSNPFHIYLHDTPATAFFDRSERAFSHGCVRLEKPIDLAVWALADPEWWDREALLGEIAKGRTRTLRLREEIPVRIVYWTAFADARGRMNFRRDIYGRDEVPEGRITAVED